MSLNEWIIPEVDKEKALKLAKKYGITPFMALLFDVRNINNEDEIKEFLNITNNFSDPFDFTGMDKLVERMDLVLKNKEKVCIYGDYDVDGVTSTSLMYLYFKEKGMDVSYYIPTRERDGYGLNKNAISYLKDKGIQLIFTVDNGISSFEEIDFANSLGMDVVITDHHRVHGKLPNAVAIVNPHRTDCLLKHKNFAGVGVAFKAIQAMETNKTSLKELLKKYSDLVALGTIGDAVELRYETVNMVKIGIKNMNIKPRIGIKELFKVSNCNDRKIDEMNMAFLLCPRINACGRIDDAKLAVELLICENLSEAEKICQKIDEYNALRRGIEAKMLVQIENFLEEEPKRKFEKIIIAEGTTWHHGVLGIVSSRISVKYGKPCIIISIDQGMGKGSARSIPGFSIHAAFTECSEQLERFGGHPMAAGITLKAENLEKFKNELINYTNKIDDIPFQRTHIDCTLNPSAVSKKVLSQLQMLAPFGSGNEEPLFGFLKVTLEKIVPLSGGKHIRLIFSRAGTRTEAVFFGQCFEDFLYDAGEIIDLAVYLKRNEYMGFEKVSVQISDIKLSYVDATKVLIQKRLYEEFLLGKKFDKKEIAVLKPERSDFVGVYRYLRNHQNKNLRADVLSYRIFGTDEHFGKVCIILDVMEELGFIRIFKNGDEFKVMVIANSEQKVDLNNSKILKNLINSV